MRFKHFYLTSLMALLLSMVSSKTFAYEEINGICYHLDDETLEAEVAKGEYNYTGNVVIPSSVTYTYYYYNDYDQKIYVTNTYRVTSIDSWAFEDCSGLTSVSIPNSVTSIGGGAFENCSGLTSVTIPNSVTSIGDEAFCGCSGLTSVTIPNSVTSINDDVFSGCSSLTSVTIPSSVTSIGYGAFSGCSSLTSVTIPNSVTIIGNLAFSGCSSLTEVTIGNSVTNIRELAFRYCSSLKCITCLATTPPTCEQFVFGGVDYSACTLKVPEASIDLYKAADQWKDFFKIIAIGKAEAGDANGDGSVTITDAVSVVDYILGNAPADFDAEAADVNKDGQVNITDAVGIVDIILNEGKE